MQNVIYLLQRMQRWHCAPWGQAVEAGQCHLLLMTGKNSDMHLCIMHSIVHVSQAFSDF